MFGTQQHAEVNQLLNDTYARRGPLVMAHRGTSSGSVAENTTLAVTGALRSGADIVEIDVTRSSDGAYVVFHDGIEPEHLRIDENLTTLTGVQIAEQSYCWKDRPERPVRIEALADLLTGFRSDADDAPLFNIDRSWPWWPEALHLLAGLGMTRQLLLKCPATHDALAALAAHSEPFPYLPICRTWAEVERVLGTDGLNVVGVEIIAGQPEHELARPDVVERIHGYGVAVLVNAEVLPIPVQCWPGLCDETAVADGPEAGWGPILDLGADIVQTDWPWLLSAYRDSRR